MWDERIDDTIDQVARELTEEPARADLTRLVVEAIERKESSRPAWSWPWLWSPVAAAVMIIVMLTMFRASPTPVPAPAAVASATPSASAAAEVALSPPVRPEAERPARATPARVARAPASSELDALAPPVLDLAPLTVGPLEDVESIELSDLTIVPLDLEPILVPRM